MTNYEIVDELVEEIADMIGNYNVNYDDNHDEDCNCRTCFVIIMKERIREAVKNEIMIPYLEDIKQLIILKKE